MKTLELTIFRQGNKPTDFAMAAWEDSFYLFGGQTAEEPDSVATIADFSTGTKQWKNIGQLKQSRKSHAVFIHHGEFVVAGGHRQFEPTERCSMDDGSIKCEVIQNHSYSGYAVVMSVPHDYCQK